MVYIELFVILALIVLNGALAMSEMAVVSSRRARLDTMAASGSRGARIALRLIDDPNRFLSTVQIGITLVGILAGAFGGATLAGRLGTWLDRFPVVAPHGDALAIAIVVPAITYLSLIVGELVPKRIALANPERVASALAPSMNALSRFAAPAVWLLRDSTDAVLGLLGLSGTRDTAVTEEEVRSMITEGTQAGIFVPQEREMIEGVMRLADRTVRAVMTARTDIVWIDIEDTHDEILRTLTEARHSRLLVCRGSTDEPVGVVHTKDLLPAALRRETIDLEAHLVPPLVVPDRTPALRLLDLFRKEGVHMAVVVDEFGSTQGVVTPTDVLEAIAGELPELGEEPELELVRRDDGSWLVDGLVPIDEFEDRMGLKDLREGHDFQTVAGFVLHHLGHLPNIGEALEVRDLRFEVVDMDGRRIDRILVSGPAVEAPEEAVE
jgi:putative hemolysin